MSCVTSIEAFAVNISPRTNWTFVAVRTDGGVTGWGECSLNRWEPLLAAYVDGLATDLTGRDIRTAAKGTRYIPHSPGGLVAHAVRSAVEQAITDVEAQMAGLPLHRWIGTSRRSSVPAYANINRGVKSRSPEGFANAARAAVAAGYRCIKLAPFDGVIAEDAASTPIEELIHDGLDRVLATRDAIGPDVPLLVDCHWRFDEARATALLEDIADAAPYWIECPISEHPSRFDAIARLRERAHGRGIRLAGGEMITGPEQATAMCAASLYDVLMPDVKYAGGYRGTMAIANVCDGHGVAFSPHNPTGPIAHLASIHVCAVAPSVLWLEHQWAESPLFDALTGGSSAPLERGAFTVPEVPGLGASLDLALVRAHPFVPLPRDANLDERLG